MASGCLCCLLYFYALFLYAPLKRCLSFVLDVVAILLFVVFQDAGRIGQKRSQESL